MTSIPHGFRWATLEAPELRRHVRRERAIDEAVASMCSGGLTLVGASRCGKTALACALLRHWEARHHRRGLFASAERLAVARDDFGMGRGEAYEVAHAMETPLLVLDGLGSESNPVMNAVPHVIYERYNSGLPTRVTTWMTPEHVARRYNPCIARRLFEPGRIAVIACGGAP